MKNSTRIRHEQTIENGFHPANSLPERHSRSRLEPYGKLIHELLRRRRTYREIARVLADRFQLHASLSTIHDFVRLRTGLPGKARKAKAAASGQAPKASQTEMKIKPPVNAADTKITVDEIQKRVAALKLRLAPAQTKSKLFQYDPNEPLHLPQGTGIKKISE